MKNDRIFALILAGALALSLTACGGGQTAATPAPSAPAAETAAPAQPAESTAPAEPAVPAEELTCASIWDAVSSGLELPKFMDLDADLLEAIYGITPDDVSDYVAKTPMMNVHATEFLIAKVQSGKMDAVKEGCKQRQLALAEQWAQYLPEQLELVENYQLVTNGDYLMFVISEHVDEAVKAFNDCTK